MNNELAIKNFYFNSGSVCLRKSINACIKNMYEKDSIVLVYDHIKNARWYRVSNVYNIQNRVLGANPDFRKIIVSLVFKDFEEFRSQVNILMILTKKKQDLPLELIRMLKSFLC